jgi:uncharacterized lipoprotein YajG
MKKKTARLIVIGAIVALVMFAGCIGEEQANEFSAMPSSWSCEPTDSVVILSYDSIACA